MSNLDELRELILSVDTTYTIDKHTTTAFILQEYYLERLVNAFSHHLEQEKLKIWKRIEIETDAVICECGEKWSETDLAILTKNSIKALTTNKSKEK